ncbi:hypothetical protein BDZ90DRAFT_230128 [Jaminaea rosea]|uniref:Peptidase A1 domain-containing protein n=1 Tax=Jaminaea rosea TaxID=1569628 RepID=A0A316V6Q5_9BASI|nr:hypothetical protein BDZ90DRAFT_230128 [Jaminaea rosea]PWN31135.1 hypothetical protein BDZ90DRAFT_230128 [Jaminaea rosea]
MLPSILSLLSLATAAIALSHTPFASRQAPNTIYPSDPVGQTASWNLTAFALPIKKSLAQSMANGHKLLPVRGLPAGYLKEDEHPLILYGGLQHDIRQVGVTIPNLVIQRTLLPFVDASNDGSTAFTRIPTVIYISQLVPALAGTLQQLNNMVLANFDPPDAAYKSIGGGQMSLSVDVGVKLDGLLGLPTPDSPVVNAIFSRAGSSNRKSIHPKFFKGVLSAPYEHTDIPTCTKQTFYFDETYAHPFRVKGSTVQVLFPSLPSAMTFKNVYGLSIAAQWDNPFGPGQSCASLRSDAQAVKYE